MILAIMIAVLGDDAAYCQSARRAVQYFHGCRIIRDGNSRPLHYSMNGQLFEVGKGTVAKQAKKWADRLINSVGDPGQGHPPVLNPSHVIDLKTCIITAYNQHRPWTMSQNQRDINDEM
jgi:hypothetical protein